MTHYQVFKTCILLSIGISLSSIGLTQSLSDVIDYAVIPSCTSPNPDKPTDIDQYYIKIDIDSLHKAEGDFDVLVDGSTILQFHLDTTDIPYQRLIGPFPHSGVGGSFHQYILRDLDRGLADTLYLPELVCGRSTSNGLNNAGYYCDPGVFGVVAQVTPEALEAPQLPEKTYVYVLIQSSTDLVVDRNFSGHFSDVLDLTDYEIHAFSTAFDLQAQFINNIVIGEPLDQDDLEVCFALCGVFGLTVDCSSFDLSLTKIVRGGFVYSIGDIVIFDIGVHNDGRVTAYNIVVQDMLPDALDYIVGMNPDWMPDLTSRPIDSLEAGASIVLPLFVRVNQATPLIEVINSAEITFASNDPDNDTPAFDNDSTPDNDEGDEDDQDDEEIIILENLCAATFDIDAGNEPVCVGSDLVLMARITMATHPLLYRWRLNGQIVSRDSMYIIPNHNSSHYGEYSLTIIDGNNCTGTEFITIEPIDNDVRFACFSDINIGINSSCEIFLRPDMFTSRDDVSALNDYTIEIRDGDNNIVDISDLSSYGSGTILEARIINPCTFETICWSNLHLENKSLPDIDIYQDDRFITMCPDVTSSNPTDIINRYNDLYDNRILSALAFADSFNQFTCVQEWDVETIDVLETVSDQCTDLSVLRVYYVFDQERRLPIDTAILLIKPIIIDSILIPEDVNNISCSSNLSPSDLTSFPAYINQGVEHTLENLFSNESAAFCNIGITYSDIDFGGSCSFGTNKILRTWTATDWCSNTLIEGSQYLFIVDETPPTIEAIIPEVTIITPPFTCIAVMDISDYIVVDDFCDVHPSISVEGYANPHHIVLPLGGYMLKVIAEDKCGNNASLELEVKVIEQSPPVPILKENLTISLTPDTDIETNYVSVSTIDAGSHDSDCGPVTLTVARATEVLLVGSQGGSVDINYNLHNCMSGLQSLDLDNNGELTRLELFRDKVVFCCQDIGSEVRLIVRVIDGSGNTSEAEVSVFVDTNLDWTACDDGDPCTINDRSYGDCPCGGTPVFEDFDKDSIIDCMDEEITICLEGVQRDIVYEELQNFVDRGAIGGPCVDEGAVATVAGEIFTTSGDMIEDVMVTLNVSRADVTDNDGLYQFGQTAMYERYELYPERDDDPVNGVSTIDLVLLQEYILQKRKIDDPYLLIAGDVNGDGKISALDIVELRRLLLGTRDGFSNNRSWRFVIEDFEFDDIRYPYDFQEINVISNLVGDMMEENWIGLKIGDLNNSAVPNSLKADNRSDQLWTMIMPDVEVSKGDKIKIPISTTQQDAIRGLQFGLEYRDLSFQSLSSGELKISSSQYEVDDRSSKRLSLVWHSEEKVAISRQLFYLTFRAERDGRLSDMIFIDQWGPKALVGFSDYSDVPIQLKFGKDVLLEEVSLANLYQNQPNPFNGETIIQFFIPSNEEVSISFFDNSGRLLLNMTDHYTQGVNAIRLTHADVAMFEGVIYYQMSYRDQLLSRKMVVTQ